MSLKSVGERLWGMGKFKGLIKDAEDVLKSTNIKEVEKLAISFKESYTALRIEKGDKDKDKFFILELLLNLMDLNAKILYFKNDISKRYNKLNPHGTHVTVRQTYSNETIDNIKELYSTASDGVILMYKELYVMYNSLRKLIKDIPNIRNVNSANLGINLLREYICKYKNTLSSIRGEISTALQFFLPQTNTKYNRSLFKDWLIENNCKIFRCSSKEGLQINTTNNTNNNTNKKTNNTNTNKKTNNTNTNKKTNNNNTNKKTNNNGSVLQKPVQFNNNNNNNTTRRLKSMKPFRGSNKRLSFIRK